MKRIASHARFLSGLLVCALLLPGSSEAARLKPQTLKAFKRYVAVTEERLSRALAERIAEVENAGKPGEKEKPRDEGAGYLWRLNTYGRYEERDGGGYIELETLALSRSVPAILAWLVNPYVRSIPREYLSRTLALTRDTLTKGKRAELNNQKAKREISM